MSPVVVFELESQDLISTRQNIHIKAILVCDISVVSRPKALLVVPRSSQLTEKSLSSW
jgi:hypothetical protein